jgi:AcrR family transcriptional regulator
MRAKIVEEALQLFGQRGVDGVSIAEVALAAGVSKANVMHHFGSKDGLYAACLDVIDEHLHAAVDVAATADDPGAALPDALGTWAAAHPEHLRVMAYGLLRLPERGGRWALSGPVERMIELVGGDPASASTQVIDLLGTITYREMARPLVEAHRDPRAPARRVGDGRGANR